MYVIIDYDKSYKKGILKTDKLEEIRFAFSEENTNVNLIRKRYGKRYFPSRSYAITSSGRFDIGLLTEIINYLKSNYKDLKIILTEQFKEKYNFNLYIKNFDIDSILLKNNIICQPRDYQKECLLKMIKYGRGIIEIATAGGKTPIFLFFSCIFLENYPNKKIFIITLPNLVQQTYNEFINNGFLKDKISIWNGNNELNLNSNIVIASNTILYPQIDNVNLKIKKNLVLQKMLKNKIFNINNINNEQKNEFESNLKNLENDLENLKKQLEKQKNITHNFFKSVDILILDEVHLFKKNNEINNIFNLIQTKNIYGFTGSLPEKKIDLWNIIGKIGPIIHKTSRNELIEKSYISDYIVKILGIEYKDSPDYQKIKATDNLTLNYELETNFIINNEYRNNVIKKIVETTNQNCLILVDKILHGEKLLEKLSDIKNKKVYYIKGEIDYDIRESIKKEIEENNNIVLIAISKIFSTGINLKNLHFIILASGGKSKEKIIQSLGRGLRKHFNKEKLIFIDIVDFLKYGENHFKERIRIYKDEKIKYEIKKIKE